MGSRMLTVETESSATRFHAAYGSPIPAGTPPDRTSQGHPSCPAWVSVRPLSGGSVTSETGALWELKSETPRRWTWAVLGRLTALRVWSLRLDA